MLDEVKVEGVGRPHMQEFVQLAGYGQRGLVDGSEAARTALSVFLRGQIDSNLLRFSMLACEFEIGWVCARVVVCQDRLSPGWLEIMLGGQEGQLCGAHPTTISL